MLAFQQQRGQKPSNRDSGGKNSKKFEKQWSSSFSGKNTFQKQSSQNFGKSSQRTSSEPPETTMITNIKASPAAASQAVSSTLTEAELRLDQIIGSFGNLNQTKGLQSPIRQLPKFLIYQSPTLNADDFLNIDEWDRENQNKMLSMEQSASDLTSLYDEFQKLREHEREVMEQKGLVDNENIRRSLEDAIIFKGSCHDMCPVYERIRRSVENDVRKYEKEEGSDRISKHRAIKAFSRPAAGQPPPLPSDVRPPQVLVQTLDYLINNTLDKLPEAQSFLWDRTRSIRQDFTYQNYSGPEAMECNEKIVRIHILTLHTMAKTNTEYSQQQELEQMNKALKTLSEMYTEYRSRGVKSPNEAEFRAYYLLSQLRDPELEREIQTLSTDILQDERVQLALQLRNLTSMNIVERGFQPSENILNFYQMFFQLLNEGKIPILISYLLEIHLNEIRFYALRSIKKAIHTKSKPYPLLFIQNLLSFNDEENAIEFCEYYGLPIETMDGTKSVSVTDLSHNSHLIPDQKPLRQFYSDKLDSQVQSFQQLINNGASVIAAIRFESNQQSRRTNIVESFAFGSTTRNNLTNSTTTNSAFDQTPTVIDQQGPIVTSSTSAFKNTQTTNKTPGFAFEFPTAKTLIDDNEREEKEKRPQQVQQEEELMLKKQKEEQIKKQQEFERMKRLEEEQKLKLLEMERQKEEQKNLVESLSRDIRDDFVKKFVKDQIRGLLQPLVKSKIEKREQKQRLLNELSQDLYEAFVNELIYVEKLQIMAEIFKKRQLKKKLIHKISQVGYKILQEQEMKKRKRDEFIRASKTWGIPALQRKRPKVAENSNSFIIKDPEPTKQQIDISPFKLDSLIQKFSGSKFPIFNILIYVEDSIVSKLLNKKFQLSNNSRVININLDNKLKITKINKIDSSFFLDVNLLVFNLIDNFKHLQELKELIKGIELNSNFKFDMIVLYWDLNNLNLESTIPKITNENIVSVKFIKISSSLKFDEIQSQLNKVGTVELSNKGEINYKYKHPKMIDPLKIDYTEQFKVNDKIIKKFQPHIEASPKFKKLPKLLSSETSNRVPVYSTPRPKSSERVQTPSYYDSSSISNLSNITFEKNKPDDFLKRPSQQFLKGSPSTLKSTSEVNGSEIENSDIPKAILELRNLAKKVKERHTKK